MQNYHFATGGNFLDLISKNYYDVIFMWNSWLQSLFHSLTDIYAWNNNILQKATKLQNLHAKIPWRSSWQQLHRDTFICTGRWSKQRWTVVEVSISKDEKESLRLRWHVRLSVAVFWRREEWTMEVNDACNDGACKGDGLNVVVKWTKANQGERVCWGLCQTRRMFVGLKMLVAG